jgi:hypothetical protein
VNMLQVYRQAPDALVMITCSRCVTAWRANNPTIAEIGLTIDRALSHVCDTDRPSMTPVRYRDPYVNWHDEPRGSTSG